MDTTSAGNKCDDLIMCKKLKCFEFFNPFEQGGLVLQRDYWKNAVIASRKISRERIVNFFTVIAVIGVTRK